MIWVAALPAVTSCSAAVLGLRLRALALHRPRISVQQGCRLMRSTRVPPRNLVPSLVCSRLLQLWL